jgi:hypothetical protein
MRQCFNLWACLAIGAVIVAGMALDRSGSPEDNRHALTATSCQVPELSDELDRRRTASLARIEARRLIVRDLIDGRITLLDAASRFRALSASGHFLIDEFRRAYAGPTDEVRYCRYVIAYVQNELHKDPERARIIVGRLQKELGGQVVNENQTTAAGT